MVRAQPRRQGSIALHEIRKYQASTDLLISKHAFRKLIHEMVEDEHRDWCGGHRFQSDALLALQEAAEDWLVSLLSDANLCTIHRKRATLNATDLRLAWKLQPWSRKNIES
jgi:histone H3